MITNTEPTQSADRKLPVSIALDRSTIDLLDEVARREQRSRSLVVRRAIRATYGPKEIDDAS